MYVYVYEILLVGNSIICNKLNDWVHFLFLFFNICISINKVFSERKIVKGVQNIVKFGKKLKVPFQ